MKAVVMAGGEGSRLRPLTIGRPKPMVPLVAKPVMGHILDLLKRHGITEVVVTLHFMPEAIQSYFGSGTSMGMHINYAIEETPLGTAGSVKNAQEFLDEPFIIISGDAVTDINLQQVIDFHQSNKAEATLTLYRVPNPLEYGVIITDADGKISQFLEKPSWGEVISDTVNTGIYVVEPQVLDLIPEGVPTDWSKDVFPQMLQEGRPLYGYIAGGNWTDIGDIAEYMRATGDALHRRVQTEDPGQHIGGDVWVGNGVEIAPDAQLYGPIYLGDEVKVKGGVIIHGPTVIRDYTIIDNRAHIDRTIIWRNCYIGEGAEIRGAIVCRQCTVKSKAVLFEGVVIGDSSIVGEGAVVHASVKVWPEKEIEPGATVKTSIIWGARGRRILFGRFGVTGVVNVDLTPEFAARLGAAFGATLPKASTVTINRDPHRSPRMIKRAVISGLPSSGIHAHDLRSMPIPVARYYTRASGAAGGVHVRLSPFDRRVVDIRFFDGQGRNLSKNAERNIERVFFREDFRRVYLDDIGTIEYAPQVVETYVRDFLQVVDAEAIRRAHFRIVVDYAFAPTGEVLPQILSQLGVEVVPLASNVEGDKMSLSQQEFEKELREVTLITGVLDAQLGVRLDVGGEKIFLVDHHGQYVPETAAAGAMAELALRSSPGGTIVVPVHMPSLFDRVAAAHGGHVLRSKVDSHDLMNAAAREGVILAADGGGNYIFPEFQPAIDGLMATVKLLEFLARQQTSLADVVASLPPYHMSHSVVSCPWEAKGRVMRLLNQQYKDRRAELIDGIKILLGEDEWVLILPDPDFPRFHIHTEARDSAEAKDLADRYVRIVEGLQG
ncbi:MAG: mannose-1-phosphate guanyltransferase [Anaerolineae bacterium]|nr:mannose-1-phosphate guanyltransferase [Anaerolineae bacterium]MDX9830741.1 mannose-1-phosphate guanyltransferase [Anaerolineae bacterium]